MNNQRRKEIRKGLKLLEEAKDIFEETGTDERDSYDNLPDNLQDSDKAYAMEEAADTLDDAVDAIEDMIDTIENIL